MIYDRLMVALLSLLSTESQGSTNALLADFIIRNIDLLSDLSVKELATACHVRIARVRRAAPGKHGQQHHKTEQKCYRSFLFHVLPH